MEVEYFKTTSGNSPIEKYLLKIPADHASRILYDIDLLQKYGLDQLKKTNDVAKIKGIKQAIWELKTRCRDNIIYRTLFESFENKIHILNIINKKEQKTRKTAIDLAVSRIKYQ